MAKKTINAIIHALENRAEKLYANAHSQRAYMAGVRDAMNELNINTSNI